MFRLLLLPLCLAVVYAQERDDPDEPAGLQEARQEWFQRHYDYPMDVRLRALNQIRSIEASNQGSPPSAQKTSVKAALSSTQWTNLGPAPIPSPNGGLAGRVNSIAIDPRDSNVVFIGTADAGVWRTRDGGASWTPLTDSQADPAIGAVALDPSAPDIVYAGTGDPAGYPGAGILKSTDGGATWNLIAQQPFASGYGGDRIYSIAVHPTNGKIVLAMAQYPNGSVSSPGIYRSTDGGVTWTRVFSGLGYQVAFNPSNGNIAYATLGQPGTGIIGVYKSTDAGATWTASNGSGANAMALANALFVHMAIAPSSPSMLYSSVSNANLLGFYRSADAGATWTGLSKTPDFCSPQCGYNNVLAVHPSDPNTIYAGGVRMYRSSDAGATWVDVTPGYVDQHALAFSSNPVKLYAGDDGGMWGSTAPQASPLVWTSLNNGLSLTQFYPGISIHPTNVNITYGGAQDTGFHRYNGSSGWNFPLSIVGVAGGTGCGDAGWSQIDYQNPNTVYLSCYSGSLWKATDGVTFNRSGNGVTVERSQFMAPLVIDPVNPQRLYFGTIRVFQTTNGAALWTPISPDLTGGSGAISDMVVAPSNPDVIYTTSGSGYLFMTSNATAGVNAVWTDRTPAIALQSGPKILGSLAVDPHNALSVYAANTAFTGPRLFHSADGGKTWVNNTGDLPTVPIDNLVIDPDLAGTLYAATDLGVFFSTDSGATWNVMGSGLPAVVVTSLKLHQPTRTLRAGTFGRGMWDISVPLPPAPVATASGLVNGASFAGGPVAPGEIFTIFGTGLGPAKLAGGSINSAGFLDSQVSTTEVLFDNVPAPLIYASDGQVAGCVPYAVAGKTSTVVQVIYRGQKSATFTVPVTSSAPGIFMISAARQGAILNQDSTVNGATNPADVGSYIAIYSTGEGQTSPAGVDGQIASASYPKPVAGVSVTIGGKPAPLAYAGALPGGVAGALQVNVQVPAGVASGSAIPVVLTVGGIASPTVNMAVR
jgi:uncharacterized protein (TIGR03437 family)